MILLALAVLAANPANLSSTLAAARPGDTVRLVAGRYPAVTIKARTFDPPVTIDAGAATVAGVQIINSTGIRWTGGTLQGVPGNTAAVNYGVKAATSKSIVIDGVHIQDFKTGIYFERVTGGTISGNWLARMSSDGIDLAVSRNVIITRNACSEFTAAQGMHPDCIQLWSRPSDPPVADIQIVGNSVVGTMQGISLFDGVHNGVPDGGFDRVTVVGNTILNTMADGIALYNCRGCTVRQNSVGSLPNYLNRAQLVVSGGSVVQCGNDVPMVPRQSTPACRD